MGSAHLSWQPEFSRPLRNHVAEDVFEYARQSPAALEEALVELRYRCAKRPKKRLVRLLRQLERNAQT